MKIRKLSNLLLAIAFLLTTTTQSDAVFGRFFGKVASCLNGKRAAFYAMHLPMFSKLVFLASANGLLNKYSDILCSPSIIDEEAINKELLKAGYSENELPKIKLALTKQQSPFLQGVTKGIEARGAIALKKIKIIVLDPKFFGDNSEMKVDYSSDENRLTSNYFYNILKSNNPNSHLLRGILGHEIHHLHPSSKAHSTNTATLLYTASHAAVLSILGIPTGWLGFKALLTGLATMKSTNLLLSAYKRHDETKCDENAEKFGIITMETLKSFLLTIYRYRMGNDKFCKAWNINPIIFSLLDQDHPNIKTRRIPQIDRKIAELKGIPFEEQWSTTQKTLENLFDEHCPDWRELMQKRREHRADAFDQIIREGL